MIFITTTQVFSHEGCSAIVTGQEFMSDAIVRVAIAISKLILKTRWLLAALISLMVVLIEVEEHHPLSTDLLNPDFLLETIVFGVILPILTGLLKLEG